MKAFRALRARGGDRVSIIVDGTSIEATHRDTVASALLLAGQRTFRVNRATGEARGPYCMMGVCFECLLTVDSVPNQQSCLIPVREGMRVETVPGRAAK